MNGCAPVASMIHDAQALVTNGQIANTANFFPLDESLPLLG